MLVPGVPFNGPPRGYTHIEYPKYYIAWHNTSNNASPQSEANYAKTRTDNVSSHFYADGGSIIQSLDTKWSAWHAGSSQGNQHGVALEMVGNNSDNATHWRGIIDRVAPAIAQVCRFHGIPVRFLTVQQAKTGVHGFVTHDVMRQAWGGTTHTDPGPNFPQDYAVQKINQYLNPVPTSKVEDDMHVTLKPGQTEFFAVPAGGAATLSFSVDFVDVSGIRVALWNGTGWTVHDGQTASVKANPLSFDLAGFTKGSVELAANAKGSVAMDVLRK